MNFSDKAKVFGFDQAINYLEKDPETNLPKLAGLVDRFLPKEEFAEQRNAVMSAIEKKDNWYQLIMKIYELDASTRITFFRNFILNENFFGWSEQERNREKSLYLSLLIFPFPIIIGTVVQLLNYGLSVIWIFIAISLLIIFIDLQNRQLSRDSLTGLYNRRQTNKQLDWEIKHITSSDCLYSMMIDVDRFKAINDEHGHSIGDLALITVAGILTKSTPKEAFISRYGGDEFVVIGHVKKPGDVNCIIETITKGVETFTAENPLTYTLSLSIGYATFNGKEKDLSIDRILSAADREMYKLKATKG
jgi:diguanylate cyclase (GGDEF)-like protein